MAYLIRKHISIQDLLIRTHQTVCVVAWASRVFALQIQRILERRGHLRVYRFKRGVA